MLHEAETPVSEALVRRLLAAQMPDLVRRACRKLAALGVATAEAP